MNESRSPAGKAVDGILRKQLAAPQAVAVLTRGSAFEDAGTTRDFS